MTVQRSPLQVAPARVGFCGDWNADLRWATRAVEEAADQGAQVLVQLGNFGGRLRTVYLSGLNTVLERAGLSLMFVDGNVEDHRRLDKMPVEPTTGLRPLTARVWYAPRGYRWTWGDTRFVAVGGAHSLDGMWRRRNGHLWSAGERITYEQADLIRHAGEADVLVSHDCPAGVEIPGWADAESRFPPIEIWRGVEHRALLAEIVQAVRPAMIWHGHYGRRYTTDAELGYGPVRVNGLGASIRQVQPRVVTPRDMVDALGNNVHVVDLAQIKDHRIAAENARTP